MPKSRVPSRSSRWRRLARSEEDSPGRPRVSSTGSRDAEGLASPSAVSRDARTWSRAASTDSNVPRRQWKNNRSREGERVGRRLLSIENVRIVYGDLGTGDDRGGAVRPRIASPRARGARARLRARATHAAARAARTVRVSSHSSFSSTFIRFHPSTSGFSHVLSPVSALW